MKRPCWEPFEDRLFICDKEFLELQLTVLYHSFYCQSFFSWWSSFWIRINNYLASNSRGGSKIASLSLKLVYAVTRPRIYIKLDACFVIVISPRGWRVQGMARQSTHSLTSRRSSFKKNVSTLTLEVRTTSKSKYWSCVCGVEKVIEVVRKQSFVSKVRLYVEPWPRFDPWDQGVKLLW